MQVHCHGQDNHPLHSTVKVGFAARFPADTIMCQWSNTGLQFVLIMYNSIYVKRNNYLFYRDECCLHSESHLYTVP